MVCYASGGLCQREQHRSTPALVLLRPAHLDSKRCRTSLACTKAAAHGNRHAPTLVTAHTAAAQDSGRVPTPATIHHAPLTLSTTRHSDPGGWSNHRSGAARCTTDHYLA